MNEQKANLAHPLGGYEIPSLDALVEWVTNVHNPGRVHPLTLPQLLPKTEAAADRLREAEERAAEAAQAAGETRARNEAKRTEFLRDARAAREEADDAPSRRLCREADERAGALEAEAEALRKDSDRWDSRAERAAQDAARARAEWLNAVAETRIGLEGALSAHLRQAARSAVQEQERLLKELRQ